MPRLSLNIKAHAVCFIHAHCNALPCMNLPIIPQTKNPTNVGLDVVKRIELFQQYHFLGLPKVRSHYAILLHAMVQTFYITRFMLVENHKVNQT